VLHLAKVAVIASLSFTALAPVAASAQQTAFTVAPVSVKSCSLNAGDIVTPYASNIRTANGLAISFTNTSGAPVSSVEIVANYNGQTETISDTGTFAPNATITHDVRAFDDAIDSGGAASCSVSKVDFADGTSWAAPATNVASAPMATR
jgi:hypothetical protein